MKRTISLLLALVMLFALTACGTKEEAPAEAVSFKVIVTDLEGNETTFEYTSSASNVGEVLVAEGLVVGHDADYGLYIDSVNGITADYNKDGEMLYIQKDRIVNGGYLLFGKELMAMEAMEQLKDKTGDELIEAFAALTSDDSTNTVKASTSYERANVDIVNKDLSAWLFDEARKDGDVKIIEKKNSKGDVDGYYLAYYVDHEIKWEKNARSSLLSAQLKEWIEELAAPYTVNEKVLNKIGKPTPVETEAETAA